MIGKAGLSWSQVLRFQQTNKQPHTPLSSTQFHRVLSQKDEAAKLQTKKTGWELIFIAHHRNHHFSRDVGWKNLFNFLNYVQNMTCLPTFIHPPAQTRLAAGRQRRRLSVRRIFPPKSRFARGNRGKCAREKNFSFSKFAPFVSGTRNRITLVNGVNPP